ncbi:hypothetical protein OG21DRAFT_359101 [Imleria badia]|nr:hypothetical protein OG21DRAFT_359101 [Imleria badia]
MYAHNHGNGSYVPQGHTPNPAYRAAPGHASNPTYALPPGFVPATPAASVPAPVPAQVPTPSHTPTAPALTPVQVPPGCYPIELVQFWRNEYKRGHPIPLHWALFVRTAPPTSQHASTPSTHGSASASTHARARPGRQTTTQTPRGNFYELVGSPDTYTAQFLSSVHFEPEALPDWRGTHVIGWVHPTQLGVFERVVRQVPVWRHRPDWRCQHWVYEAVSAVGTGHPGVFVDGVTFVGLQKQMGRLLDAWENGDI